MQIIKQGHASANVLDLLVTVFLGAVFSYVMAANMEILLHTLAKAPVAMVYK